jgi:hypothetical protein
MATLHLFINHLVEQQMYLNEENVSELDSIRNIYRKRNVSISLTELQDDTREYFEAYLSEKNKRDLKKQIFSHIDDTSCQLTPEYIVAFEDEIGMNVVRRNPRTTLVLASLTAIVSFIGPLLGIFIFEAVSHTAFVTLLPFLAGLGPVGAAMAAAAIITVGAMAIYGLVIGITAAATSKKVKVDILEDVQVTNGAQMSQLGGPSNAPDQDRIPPPQAKQKVDELSSHAATSVPRQVART